MPPSTKRRSRKETNEDQGGETLVADSSPSRPAKRRKRGSNQNDDAESSQSKPVAKSQYEKLSKLGPQEIADRVAAILEMPDRFVQVTRDHSNDKEANNSKGIQAYAKIAGKDWTYYVRTLETQIGRAPEGVYPSGTAEEVSREEGSLPAVDTEASRIQIDLGPDKFISRQHAEIFFDSMGEGCWYIIVNGRNPIKVEDTTLRRGEKMKLRCGIVIEIGRVQMLFILPGEEMVINKRWLRRASLIPPAAEDQPDEKSPEPVIPGRANPAGPGGPSYPTPIAPAPPDYRRAGTPLSSRGGFHSTTPGGTSYANGTMILTATDHLDLSLEENAKIKPSYSYAQLISQAILDSEHMCTTLNKIYEHIMKNYAYYRNPDKISNWQNSIRHNLSLSKQFGKIPRSFDEPGKGMKWHILPDFVEEMTQSCRRGGRGGARAGSAPGSPAVGGSSRHNPSLEDITGESPVSADRLMKGSPRSPPLSSYPTNAQHTPDQRMSASMSGHAHEVLGGDGSPLPRHRRQNGNTYGLSDNIQGSPPALSSSYLPDEGNSFITPAPHRVHPRLIPPSTAQRPSQHMLTSSPAPFWKYLDKLDQTPNRDAPEPGSSPIKGSAVERSHQSSSPPPSRVGETGSPSRNQVPSSSSNVKRETVDVQDDDDEEPVGIDLTRGFQSISTFHSQANSGVTVNGRS